MLVMVLDALKDTAVVIQLVSVKVTVFRVVQVTLGPVPAATRISNGLSATAVPACALQSITSR